MHFSIRAQQGTAKSFYKTKSICWGKPLERMLRWYHSLLCPKQFSKFICEYIKWTYSGVAKTNSGPKMEKKCQSLKALVSYLAHRQDSLLTHLANTNVPGIVSKDLSLPLIIQLIHTLTKENKEPLYLSQPDFLAFEILFSGEGRSHLRKQVSKNEIKHELFVSGTTFFTQMFCNLRDADRESIGSSVQVANRISPTYKANSTLSKSVQEECGHMLCLLPHTGSDQHGVYSNRQTFPSQRALFRFWWLPQGTTSISMKATSIAVIFLWCVAKQVFFVIVSHRSSRLGNIHSLRGSVYSLPDRQRVPQINPGPLIVKNQGHIQVRQTQEIARWSCPGETRQRTPSLMKLAFVWEK